MKKNEEKKEGDLMEVFKSEKKTPRAGILWRRRLTTQNPLSFNKEVTNKNKR